jgi:RNA polymerase sigma-70 factor (ECF subfamily)
MTSPSQNVTGLLVAWSNGNPQALDELMPMIYQELSRMARNYMGRERIGHTLQTKALVNEAYLRLVDQQTVHWQNRAHFFAIAAQMMRRILVDYARSRLVAKRGGGAAPVSLDEVAVVSGRASELVALDEALLSLAAFDPRKAQVVELRFFGGLSVEETAEVLKISPNTVIRDCSTAKAWLHRELNRDH